MAPLAAAWTPDWLEFLPISLNAPVALLASGVAPPDLARMHEHLDTLRTLALRHARADRMDTAIPGVAIMVTHQPTLPTTGMFQPRFCLVLQGAKEVTIGERRMRYDPNNYFIASLEVPATGCVMEASARNPYVGVSLALDADRLAGLISEMPARTEGDLASFAVSPVTADLLAPCVRLLGLLDNPDDIPVLAPMMEREILYRLLQGPQGAALRQIARGDSRLGQVRRAIGWIRDHFDQAMRVDQLAELAGMSTASFHRHFKAATAMSPLQYQKNLRLQEARRMLATKQDAARVGYAVGYESASQFSREYARQFGLPPARDAVRLRNGEVAANATA